MNQRTFVDLCWSFAVCVADYFIMLIETMQYLVLTLVFMGQAHVDVISVEYESLRANPAMALADILNFLEVAAARSLTCLTLRSNIIHMYVEFILFDKLCNG